MIKTRICLQYFPTVNFAFLKQKLTILNIKKESNIWSKVFEMSFQLLIFAFLTLKKQFEKDGSSFVRI